MAVKRLWCEAWDDAQRTYLTGHRAPLLLEREVCVLVGWYILGCPAGAVRPAVRDLVEGVCANGEA